MRFTNNGFPGGFPGFRLPSGKMRIGPNYSAPLASPPSRLTEQSGFGSNPGELRMFTYMPARLSPNAPLVVMLHGCTQDAAIYDHGAGWSALADELGFAVLAPQQQQSNNASNCFNWFQPGDTKRGEGEAASIHQMVTRIMADHQLDPRRVYITGLSAGGAMTAAMLSLYPEMFAGGAIIAGLPFGTAHNVPEALNHMRQSPAREGAAWADAVRRASATPHTGPWPIVSIWHGDADATVNINNSEALTAQWLALHGVDGAPLTMTEDGHVKQSWKDAAGQTVVEAITIKGMGHGTPVGGTENYGVAGKHFFETEWNSSVRIAQFWGLAKGPVRARPKPHVSFAPGGKTGGVKDAIVKALKAAGLM